MKTFLLTLLAVLVSYGQAQPTPPPRQGRVDHRGCQQDIAARFLKGTIEGMAIYMNNREETLRVLAKYHGIKDRAVANGIYEEGLKMTRSIEPCAQGFRDMFTLGYAGIDKYKPTDFYDDSFIKELEKSGFIAAAYKTAR